MIRWSCSALCLTLSLLWGCVPTESPFDRATGDDDAADDDAADDDTGDDDAADDDAGDDDAADDDAADDDTGDDDTGDTTGEYAKLELTVLRSTDCQEDCRGSFYVALLEGPVGTAPPATIVAVAADPAADLRDGAIPLVVTLGLIPPSTTSRWISGFFDDDASADPASPHPDSGDLLVSDSGGAPTIVMDTPTVYQLTVTMPTARP